MHQALRTDRAELIQKLAQDTVYDLAVVGGGATGLGVALDAAQRGLKVLLLESHDFAKGSSSRATKLVHGGVRYLAQGHLGLVREALHERRTLLNNAPHLAQPLAFVLPTYRGWEKPWYGLGLKLYDLLAGRAGLGHTTLLGRDAALAALPGVQAQGLRGAVQYWDGQFDDARLALALAQTAAAHGALLLNYCEVTDLLFDAGKVAGLVCHDREGGGEYRVRARCVVNAAGVWVDALRMKDAAANPDDGRSPTQAMVAPSQGVHVVVDADFLPGNAALIVPKTADGRVLFAVPWLGKVILGTTDTPRHDLAREPRPFKEEIDFILQEAGRYLCRSPARSDVRSVWVGLRPLVKPLADDTGNTKALSREHTILVSRSGLVTVTGGKWTTYRAMADAVLQTCARKGLLATLPPCATAALPLVGAQASSANLRQAPGLHLYGSQAAAVQALPGAGHWLTEGLSEAMVRYAARYEYARTVEDVLARRSRLLFLDAQLAGSLAAKVGMILWQETGINARADAFLALSREYLTFSA